MMHVVVLRIGRNCVISERSVIRPPSKRTANRVSFYPLIIGDCVFIEEDVVLQANTVGSYVHIGTVVFANQTTYVQ